MEKDTDMRGYWEAAEEIRRRTALRCMEDGFNIIHPVDYANYLVTIPLPLPLGDAQ